MYLLSQDKKILIVCRRISVEWNITVKKDGKWAIAAFDGAGTLASPAVMGLYETEDQAKAELKSILTALENGCATYEVR